MAQEFKFDNLVFADALARMNGAPIRIYAGAVPVDSLSPIGAAVLLAESVCSNPAILSIVGKVATLDTIPAAVAVAAGVPTFFRISETGTVGTYQGTVGPTGNLVLNQTMIGADDDVRFISCVIRRP